MTHHHIDHHHQHHNDDSLMIITTRWWFQPIWKILVKLEIFPNFRGENNTYLKPPPRWWPPVSPQTFCCLRHVASWASPSGMMKQIYYENNKVPFHLFYNYAKCTSVLGTCNFWWADSMIYIWFFVRDLLGFNPPSTSGSDHRDYSIFFVRHFVWCVEDKWQDAILTHRDPC